MWWIEKATVPWKLVRLGAFLKRLEQLIASATLFCESPQVNADQLQDVVLFSRLIVSDFVGYLRLCCAVPIIS